MHVVLISNYNLGNETGTAKITEILANYLSQNHQVLYICLGKKYKLISKNEAPASLRSGYLLPSLRREQNPSEAENSSHSSSDLRPRFSAKGDKNLTYLLLPAISVKQGFFAQLTPQVVEKLHDELMKFSPDIIHAQNVVFASLLALIWAVKNNVPYIVTFHSLPSEGLRYIFPKISKDNIVSMLNSSLTTTYVDKYLQATNLVIALNKSVVTSVKKINKTVPLKIIHNGLDLSFFNQTKPQNIEDEAPSGSRSGYFAKGDKINFVFLGSFSSRKNQDYLLEVFRYLPSNFTLNLYGNTKTGADYISKLNKSVQKYKLKNVHINNYINDKKKAYVLAKSDYFLSASLKEVQSLVVIEALASGTPVIGLANETLNEIIDSKNGLKLPQKTTPAEFAQKAIDYVNHTNRNYNIVSNYARTSVEKFNINKVGLEIVKTYTNVIDKHQNLKKTRKRVILDNIVKLIPQSFSDLANLVQNNMAAKQTNKQKGYKQKPGVLKVILSIVVAISVLVSGISYLVNLFKKQEKKK